MSVRLARTFVLLAWAELFALLWLTGETSRYLGPRTSWVVPFGTVTLTAAALAYGLAAVRGDRRERLSRTEAAGLLGLLVPILAVIFVPQAELGALAASRKATDRAAASWSPPNPSPSKGIAFAEIDYAGYSQVFAQEAGIRPGRRVELVGFVSKAQPAVRAPFPLSRFYVSCCAADAIPYSVTIDPAGIRGDFSSNTWLQVSGVLRNDGEGFYLEAGAIRKVNEPQDPYLY